MRLFIAFIFILSSALTFAAESKLVDVDKSSKLSDYFKKINKKVSDDPESKELVTIKKVPASQSKKQRAEDEILLKAATNKETKTSSMSPMNKMMVVIFGLLFVAAGVFATIQKMGKDKGHTSIAKNIKILTQKSIGPKKNLMLIRVAGETILLGVTDNNINHIKTLSLMEDELPSYTEPQFSSQLKEKIDQTKITDEPEVVDGFAVSRLDAVKDAVSKRFSI